MPRIEPANGVMVCVQLDCTAARCCACWRLRSLSSLGQHKLSNSGSYPACGAGWAVPGQDRLVPRPSHPNPPCRLHCGDPGDWFNRLDWSMATNNFPVGLPVASKNADQWPEKRPFLARRVRGAAAVTEQATLTLTLILTPNTNPSPYP